MKVYVFCRSAIFKLWLTVFQIGCVGWRAKKDIDMINVKDMEICKKSFYNNKIDCYIFSAVETL